MIEDPETTFEYGDAVLRETMRLKSVAPLIFVEPLDDVTVAGVDLPRGTRVIALTRYAGAHGAATFDPERERDPKRFLTFGAGARFCPGRNLALLEARTALAMLTRNFRVTRARVRLRVRGLQQLGARPADGDLTADRDLPLEPVLPAARRARTRPRAPRTRPPSGRHAAR